MDFNYEGYRIVTAKEGKKVKAHCPVCADRRKDKRDKSLFIDTTSGAFRCFYCDWAGKALKPGEQKPVWEKRSSAEVPSHFRRPVFDSNKTMLSDKMVRYFVEQRCIPQEVLKKMLISEEMHFMSAVGKQVKCIGFNYFVDDELVNTKYRDAEKHFALVAGAKLTPWNIDGIKDTKECILTEGEMDAMSFMAAGRYDVVSVPNGANENMEWLNPFVESHFENKEIIYIAVDTDEKGKMLCKELLRRFGKERCRVVTYGKDCKDANEHLLQYGVESLQLCLLQAPECPLEGVVTVEDVKDEMYDLFENGLQPGLSIGYDNLDPYLTLETGRVCVVTGIPGCGKSEFMDQIVINMNLKHGWKTAYFSPENLPVQRHYAKLAEKLTGKIFKKGNTSMDEYRDVCDYLKENVFSIAPKEGYRVDSILSRARELVRRNGIKMLVIDPYNRLEHQFENGEKETTYISRFLDKLTNFAISTDTLVVLVAHPRKIEKDPITKKFAVPDLYTINGSANFFNKTDYGFAVVRDNDTNQCTIHVQKVKFRNLGKCGEATFAFNLTNGRYVPIEPSHSSKGGFSPAPFDNSNWLTERKKKMEMEVFQQEMPFDTEERTESYELPF